MADDTPKPPSFSLIAIAAVGSALGCWFSSKYTSNIARLERQEAAVRRLVRARTRKAAHRQGRHPNTGLLTRRK